MGLDILEFVLGVEEAFGLRIPDDVRVSLTTPRRLIDYLYGQLPQSPESRCLSQRAFYAVRRALGQRLGVPHSALRPATELLAVLSGPNAQADWAAVGEALGAPRWPRARGGGRLAGFFLHARPRTLGEAARHVVTFTPGVAKRAGEGWSWPEVAKVVDGLMRYHFGVVDYSLDDRFVEDLGLV